MRRRKNKHFLAVVIPFFGGSGGGLPGPGLQEVEKSSVSGKEEDLARGARRGGWRGHLRTAARPGELKCGLGRQPYKNSGASWGEHCMGGQSPHWRRSWVSPGVSKNLL